MRVTTAHTQYHHDFTEHVRIRWSAMFGGWLMTCPKCIAFTVRGTWPEALHNADRHVALHQRAPWFNPDSHSEQTGIALMMSVMMTLDTTEAQAEMEKYHNAHKGSVMSSTGYSCSGAGGVGKEFQAVTASQAPSMMSMMSMADRLTATPAFMSKADPKALSAFRMAKSKRPSTPKKIPRRSSN